MFQQNIVLLIVFALGVLFNNSLIASSAGILLVLKFIRLHSVMTILEHRSLEAGLLLLSIAVLVPFATGRVVLTDVMKSLRGITGIVAVVSGVLAAYVCGRGVGLLQTTPQMIVGLVIGTIMGVFLLKGIPIGPLAAAGFAAVLLRLMQVLKIGG